MAKRRRVPSSGRTGQTQEEVGGIGPNGSARKPSKPAPIEPFHVAVDRQLKSGHASYEAAEKAALEIKKRYPKLHVTVYDTQAQRHTTIEQPKAAGGSNKNRLAEGGAGNVERRHAAGGKH